MIPNSPAAWSARADAEADPHRAVRWSASGQRDRHESVIAALDPKPGDRLLDFGCGTGALSDLVPAGVTYVGWDSAPGMLARARADHPRKSFPTFLPDGPFDLIACIGPFNLPDGWSKEQTWETLASLCGRCRRSLAVCLYAGEDPACLIYSEAEVEEAAWRLSAHPTVERHRPNDILLILRSGGHL